MIGWDDILVGGEALPRDAAGGLLASRRRAQGRRGRPRHGDRHPRRRFTSTNRQADLASEPTGRGAIVSLADVYKLIRRP